MREIMLSVRNGVLILLMVWGLFTGLIGASTVFVTRWHAPGLISLILVVALEAIITQRLVARERMRMEEQVGVRALELLIVLLLVRVWSLAGQGERLDLAMGPWLRDPLQFFNGRFAEYLLWAVVAWFVATLLASDVINWASDEIIEAMPEQSIERDQLQNEWDQSVTRFRKRYMALILITLASSALALHGLPMQAEDGVVRRSWTPVIAAMSALVAGLLLTSSGRLHQLRRNWRVDNMMVDAGIDQRWRRYGVLLVIALVILSPLLGWIVLIAPPPPLVPVLNVLMVGMTLIVSVMLLLIGILLSPFIFLLSLMSSGERTVMPAMPRIEAPQIIEGPRERPLLPALIFWGCVLVLIGIALMRYMRGRADVITALRRWRWTRWLASALDEWWTDARSWVAVASASIRRWTQRRQRRRPRAAPERNAQAQVRLLYQRMRTAGTRQGVTARQAQTPYEYSSTLVQALPQARDDVQGLTDVYVVAEYGPHAAGPSELRQARRHWQRLQRWLLGVQRRLRRF